MRKAILAGLILLIGAMAFGQSISSKQDIAIFRLSYYDLNIPESALAQVDQRIEDVFVNIGRFNIIGMNYRLSESDIVDFIAKLKELKQVQTAIPKEFSLGKEAFTEADLNRLLGSFVIVVPVLTSYSLQYEQSTGYTAELQTSFSFINAQTSTSIAHFSIRTLGVGPSPRDAARDAASAISQQLVYKIRTIPDFQLKTGVIEVNGSTVLIELGRNMGVRLGDEYAIITSRLLPSGYTVSDTTGLLIVKAVNEDISYAQVIYSATPPQIGDQLKEVPRIGFESSFYSHLIVASEVLGLTYSPVVTVGVMQTLTRGFYNFRPLVGAEIPLSVSSIGGAASYGTGGLPVNLYLGGQLNWRFWRFDLAPLAAVGIGGFVPASAQQSFYVSIAGGLAQLSLSYLVSPQVKLFADTGYEQWLPISMNGWGGFYGGLGVSINY
jgi:hypothetical protein